MHLLKRQRIVRLHRSVTGGRGRNLLERILSRSPRSRPSRSSASARTRIALSRGNNAGIAVTLMLSPPKSSTSKPNLASASARAPEHSAPPPATRESSEPGAAGSRGDPREPLHDLFEEHALVCDVLVDDGNPSSSIAMMNVSRNWPSGIMGRMSAPGAGARRPASAVRARPAGSAPARRCAQRSHATPGSSRESTDCRPSRPT